ncbi:hypothetical protein NFI96_020945 [Prochilodus magdalenae]|nr:hypothetical protein NFI96_020945 [Prochilodus magdalenae]
MYTPAMLHNGAGTSGGRHGSSAQKEQQQLQCVEEEPSELSRSHLKSSGNGSTLTSPQCLITKNTIEETNKQQLQFSFSRPSVLRKGNQVLSQALYSQSSLREWPTEIVCKAEFENNPSVTSSSYGTNSPSRHSASGTSPRPSSPEHHTEPSQVVLESLLYAKGVCRWPGCGEVFKEYTHFLKHLYSEHRPGDKTIEQWRLQRDMVKQMENQLIMERQRLKAMYLHLFDINSCAENNPSLKQSSSPSGSLQANESVPGHQGGNRVPAEMLPPGYWQIPTSQFIPGIITSIECYKYTNIRPPFTYASMIRWAILESPEKQLTLNEIYHWFTRMFFYFRHNTATWKNAVRHNLSLHKCFVRVDGGKGSVWTVDEAEFLRRKGQKLHRYTSLMGPGYELDGTLFHVLFLKLYYSVLSHILSNHHQNLNYSKRLCVNINMSGTSDSSKPSACKKRSASPRRESELGCPLSKHSKVDDEEEEGDVRVTGSSERSDGEATPGKKDEPGVSGQNDADGSAKVSENASEADGSSGSTEKAEARACGAEAGKGSETSATPEKERSDSAAFAAAEALASLTGGGQGRSHDHAKEMPCSSRQALKDKVGSSRPGCSSKERERERDRGRHAEAAVADSSSSVLGGTEREDGGEQDEEEEEEDDDSLAASSSTASSSVASDNEENEDGECAIVAVRMAPEVRQSVALLAQVQMRLDALEKKGARLHQRLELKLSRQRRPHLDQRGAITQTIPGFWVTALLNHPHLSAHIDENDEDALSYMTNLEIETFKNNKLGYRICFHFRRNPFFQNKVIVKELHLGMGGSPVSFSNPILWHRGQNLTGNGEPRRTSRGVYQSFFQWFSDHSSPGRDEIAQILKDDLYRNPLRYYLTPLWEPRQNGSTPKPPDNSNGNECVIISDSDDDQEVINQDKRREQEEEDDDIDEDEGRVGGKYINLDVDKVRNVSYCADISGYKYKSVQCPHDSDQEAGDSSFEEREDEELDIEEVDDSRDSTGGEIRQQDQEEEDIDVNDDAEDAEDDS